MREIEASTITQAVARLCQQANFVLDEDVLKALKQAQKNEESPSGREVLSQLIKNARIARQEQVPLCQDCGTAVIFLEIGQETHIINGELYTAVTEGVRQGYAEGYLRQSIVSQPFSARINTRDNTPPIIHTEIVAGDRLKVIVMPKGGGAENMSRLAMLKPGDGREGVIFADQAQNSHGRLVIIILGWNANGLDHGADAVHIVIGKADDPFRTGAHTGSATTATGRVRFWRPLFIIVQSAKGAFLCAAFALRATLEEKVREGQIPGSRMNGDAAIHRFHTLNGF